MLFNASVVLRQFLVRTACTLLPIVLCVHCSFFQANDLRDDWTFGRKETHIAWSSPQECSRECKDGENPRICYYHFTLEYYATMGRACELCEPSDTNQLRNQPGCQCIQGDGFERGMLSINRMFPGPSIQVCENDRIVIDVQNNMEGMETTLHWHGIKQHGYQYYDGVPFLTQCPISFGTTFRYQFAANNAGTHFYHSHAGLQKIDGLHGSLIVRHKPSRDPHWGLYDEDLPTHVIVLSDWMHDMSIEHFPGRLRMDPGQTPENVLINGKGRWTDPATNQTTTVPLATFTVEPGKRYRFRVVNAFSSVCPAQLTIEGHSLKLIAQDGEPVEMKTINTIISSSGERADFILEADQTVRAYWMQVRALRECRRNLPNQLAILRYAGGSAIPTTNPPQYANGLEAGIIYNPLNAMCGDPELQDMICPSQLKSAVPVSRRLLKAQPDHRIMLPYQFYSYNNDIGELFKPGHYKRFLVAPDRDHINSVIDGISFKFPPSPPLSQELHTGETCNRNNMPSNCEIPCECPHVHHIRKGAIVELVIYDEVSQPMLSHPFHLHGYAFRVLQMGRFADGRNISRSDINEVMQYHQRLIDGAQYELPAAKDTIAVPHAGYVILRFKADNPGWWLLHCHFVFHSSIGMSVVFHVGEKQDLPPVPRNFPQCSSFQPPVSFTKNGY